MLLSNAAAQLACADAADFAIRPQPQKWSKKEILGHLVDSAQNNLQRFVRAQYEELPRIVYAQHHWVALQHYQEYELKTLVQLWESLNRHLCHVWQHLPPSNRSRLADNGELHDLEWLAEDYVRHLKHHLSQILQLHE